MLDKAVDLSIAFYNVICFKQLTSNNRKQEKLFCEIEVKI